MTRHQRRGQRVSGRGCGDRRIGCCVGGGGAGAGALGISGGPCVRLVLCHWRRPRSRRPPEQVAPTPLTTTRRFWSSAHLSYTCATSSSLVISAMQRITGMRYHKAFGRGRILVDRDVAERHTNVLRIEKHGRITNLLCALPPTRQIAPCSGTPPQPPRSRHAPRASFASTVMRRR